MLTVIALKLSSLDLNFYLDLKEMVLVKVYKFIHLPVQSGSDGILRKMRRNYTVKDFEKIIHSFRKTIPNITISTDIIVGFPGENGKDFKKTLDLIKRIKPDIVNISKFGARPGTEASGMKQIDNRTAKSRSKKLSSLVKKIGLEKNREWKGEECLVLVNEKGKEKNQFIGRNEHYKPVVINTRSDMTGKFLKVKIKKVGQTYLKA